MNLDLHFPGTDLYKKLEAEGRILDHDWEKYNLNNVVIQPKNMKPEQLQFNYEVLVHYLNRIVYNTVITPRTGDII